MREMVRVYSLGSRFFIASSDRALSALCSSSFQCFSLPGIVTAISPSWRRILCFQYLFASLTHESLSGVVLRRGLDSCPLGSLMIARFLQMREPSLEFSVLDKVAFMP